MITYNSKDAAAAMVLAMAAAAISILLTKAQVTRKFRIWISSKSKFAEGLFKCAYCMGHWWIFPGAIYYDLRIIQSPIHAVDVAVSGFATVFVATILEGLMILALSIMDSSHRKEAPEGAQKGEPDGKAPS